MQQQFAPQGYNWAGAENSTKWSEAQHDFKDDSVIGFFQRHPKLMMYLFEKIEILLKGVLLWFFVEYRVNEALAELSADATTQTALRRMTTDHTMIANKQFEGHMDTFVTGSMEVDGTHFLAHILEVSEAEIKEMGQHNHNMALSHGYYDVGQGPNGMIAYNTPWGVTYQQGVDQTGNPQWGYQAHQQNIYGQQGYPPAMPNGMPNPHTSKGGLATSIVGALSLLA